MGVTIQRDMLDAARMLPADQGRDLVYALVAYGLDGELPDEGEPWYPMWFVTKSRIEASVKRNSINKEMTARRLAKQEKECDQRSAPKERTNGDDQRSAPKERTNGDDQRSAPKERTNPENSPSPKQPTNPENSPSPKQPSEVRRGEVRRGEDEVRMRRGEESSKRIESGTDDGGSPLPDGPVPYGAIVGRLNRRAGADYRPSSRATRRLIDARWREGYRLPDFEAVVDAKCSEWAGTEMAKYLRPQTLFGTKFEAYRSQASMDRGGGAPDGWYDFASLDAE